LARPDPLSFLTVLQLADSALPIGSLAHSFGLEALVYDGDLDSRVTHCPAALTGYLEDALAEWLLLDAVYCREAHTRALESRSVDDLNQRLSALRLARESREASLTLGRRFAALVASLHPSPALGDLAVSEELHHSIAFGYTFGILEVNADLTVSAFLHQSILNIVSAAQRLLPLGQHLANRIVWGMKPAILDTMELTRSIPVADVRAFSHLSETASMRHSFLPTRLFIS